MKNKFKISHVFTPTPKFLVRGFTIIELLITIFIFSTVMIMASSSFVTSYISGRTHSSSSMEANRSLTTVLDIIGQKMANANGKADIDSTTFYGFHVVKSYGGLLTIVLQGGQCAYFAQKDYKIKMLQSDICFEFSPTVLDSWETISSPNIGIITFNLSTENEYNPISNTTAPYLTVTIIGEDPKTKGKATLETTYSIPAYTYNKW